MKKLCINYRKLYTDKKVNQRFAVFSDIHYSTNFDQRILKQLYEACLKNKPQYILIPGDLLDFASIVKSIEHREILNQFLQQLASIASVLLSYGNHDLFDKDRVNGKDEWKSSDEAFSFLKH